MLLMLGAVVTASFVVSAAVETRTTISVLLASTIVVVFAAAAAVAAHLVARSDPPDGRLVRARTAPGTGPLEVRAVAKVEQRRLRLRGIRGAGAGGRERRRVMRRIVVHRIGLVVRCCPFVPVATIERSRIMDGCWVIRVRSGAVVRPAAMVLLALAVPPPPILFAGRPRVVRSNPGAFQVVVDAAVAVGSKTTTTRPCPARTPA
jgi:hypothetical protein